MGPRRCHALLCAYDGGAFSGFQRQPPLPTIQGALEDGLRALGIEARVEGAGRTDAGVHARRQLVTLRTRSEVGAHESLPARLARHLPRGLAILGAVPADDSFHARFSAVGKLYRYRVSTSETPTEWERRFCWVLPDPRAFPELASPLDTEAIAAALQRFEGRHDFTKLVHPRGEGKRVRLLTRAVHHARPAPGGGTIHELNFAGPGFLRHQVRNLVGVTVSAALGKLEQEELGTLLDPEGDRWRGPRAPARGLTLWDINYRADENPFSRRRGS